MPKFACDIGKCRSITIDLEMSEVAVVGESGNAKYSLASDAAFEVVSQAWLRAGWDNKYVYGFSWMGRPIIQLPEDILRLQEVIYAVKPDIILETGIAHGGSAVFYASLCKAMGKGRVIAVDIDIRPHNRQAIESHELAPLITLVEGNSIDVSVHDLVRSMLPIGATVLAVLDSGHTKDHVLAELNLYAPLVAVGSYIVVADGIMEQVVGAPRTQPNWAWNNPRQAALEFVGTNQNYTIEHRAPPFNEGNVTSPVTYFADGYIKRVA